MGYTQVLHQGVLAVDPVLHGHNRKIRAIGLIGIGIDGLGAGAAMATTQVIQANHEITVSIDGLARPDTGIPPTGFFVLFTMKTSRMMMAAKGVADQHRIVFGGAQAAIGFIHQLVMGQCLATLQGNGVVTPKQLGLHDAHGACRAGGRCWYCGSQSWCSWAEKNEERSLSEIGGLKRGGVMLAGLPFVG